MTIAEISAKTAIEGQSSRICAEGVTAYSLNPAGQTAAK
jgi:hypothetical protein